MTRWNHLTKAEAKKLGIEGEYKLMKLEEETEEKYHNKRTEVNGIKFQSQKEANFYKKLKTYKAAGEVIKFELQPKFRLLDGFDDKQGNHHRPINYFADFKVWWADGTVEVIDTKGYRTQVYKIKKKLLLDRYPEINFREV